MSEAVKTLQKECTVVFGGSGGQESGLTGSVCWKEYTQVQINFDHISKTKHPFNKAISVVLTKTKIEFLHQIQSTKKLKIRIDLHNLLKKCNIQS